MKNLKKLLMLLLAFSLSLALFACGGGSETCDTCVDTDGDGKCDVCDSDVEPGGGELPANDIALIEDGVANFRIVLGSGIATDARKAVDQQIVGKLRNSHDIEVKSAQEGGTNDEIQEIEVLIGDVTTRGENYIFDRYELGKEGYMIKIVGSKILINAGSDEMLVDAIIEFADNILKIGTDDVNNVTMLTTDAVYVVQDDYKIESLKVDGTDMKGYTIAVDSWNKYHKAAALLLQDVIYDRTGYHFKIVKPEAAGDKSIVIKSIPKVSGDESFTIEADGTKLVISCAYDNMTEQATGEFLTRFITLTSEKNVNFSGEVFKRDVSVVYYEDFGAEGDGETDDFDAIYKTHEFANISGQTVKADPDATYYIFNTAESGKATARTAIIKTNVDWQGAKFIIDDRNIGIASGSDYKYLNQVIFKIVPDDDLAAITLKAAQSSDAEYVATILGDGITRSSTHITIPKEAMDGWEGPVMLNLQNSAHNIYRRKGYGGAGGSAMSEVVYVNADGTIQLDGDHATPIIFDYQSLSTVTIYRLDESRAITVENGTFTTRACQANTVGVSPYNPNQLYANDTYISRGISINRSYTTLDNIKHYVTDEIPLIDQIDENGKIVKGGCPYSAFYNPSGAHHIVIQNCILSGRRCYQRPQGGTTGTYDLGGGSVNYLIYKNCVQHNFWVTVDPETFAISAAEEGDEGAKTSMGGATVTTSNGTKKSLSMHWGIGGTNRCKNLYYDGSTLSRFDAHEGLYNGGIINGSTVNYIELIGFGTFEFTDSRLFTSGNNVLLPLRSDYGWVWEGEMIARNVKAFMYPTSTIGVTYFGYNNWYFGYTCAFPSIELDNVDFYDISAYYKDWTLKPLDAGHEILLTNSEITRGSKMHLDTSHAHPIYSIEDRDNNGYIDEPSFDRNGDGVVDSAKDYDLDGDGKNGNTKMEFAPFYNNGVYGGDGKNSGVVDTGSYVNLCRVIPPEYIKIINNDGVDGAGGYKYIMWDTSGQGVSDGGYYDGADPLGGFFGGTKFIYGNGKDDYFIGTKDKNGISPSFTFR